MERRSSERQTMVLNRFSRVQFKRRDGTGRLTTKRPISFENLLLSGKTPVPPAMSSLYKNISTTLKENVNPEAKVSQNVDDFWAVERQKRISAVARRKLTGGKETTQEANEPVEDRKARHARSRRVGGKRTVGAKPKKLDVYIDAELIADWDKENLEVEEEKPCTIESSEAFMSAQETALRASLKVLNTMDHRVEAVPGTCSPTHSQVNACKSDGEPQAQTPGQYYQGTNAKSSSSLEDMDLSSGESPDCLMQNIMNPHDCTPDLASLVEMDWNTSCPPRAALENALNSQATLRYRVQDAAGTRLDAKPQTFSPRLHEPLDKLRGDCLVADSRADRRSLVSTAQLRSQQFEQEGRINEDQGCISSLLMHCSLDKDVSSRNRDGTPFHEAQSQRTRLPTTSPTPPSNPFAVYMSRRQLLNETGELSQRKLAFGSCSPSSSLNSDKTKQAEKVDLNAGKALSCEGPNEDTPRFYEPPFSPIKSIKTKQVEKTRLSSAAKSLRFEDEDNSSPRLCEAPVSASSVKENQAGKTGVSVAAKTLNFEDIEVEAALDAEEAELLIEEPRAATELGVCLPVDVEENTSNPCASQQCPPDDITAETHTSMDLQSQPDDITTDIQPCTDLKSQADNVAAEKLQPESQQQSQAKKPKRRKVQDRRSSLEGSENGCTWKDGQRRSQRIRVRPLEWWRGEKLLYGRVHDSLTSVIGIKQSSPGQYARGIKAPFVIESFVPSKYSELVRFAAI